MSSLFIKLLNMSITASYLVLGIFLLRILLRKAPKWIFVLLWGLVALRLLLPFSIESRQSLIPSSNPIPQEILYTANPTIHSGIPIVNSVVNPIISESLTPEIGASATPVQSITEITAGIWVLGMVAMIAYFSFTYFRLRHSLREAILYDQGIWICDRIPSPFLLGIFRPRIYLPSDLEQEDIPFILAHEQAHI